MGRSWLGSSGTEIGAASCCHSCWEHSPGPLSLLPLSWCISVSHLFPRQNKFHEMPCFSHCFLAHWHLSRISNGWLELLSHLWALTGKEPEKSRKVSLLPWGDKPTSWEILQTLEVFEICWAATKYKCPALALSSITVWKKKIQFRRHKFSSKTTLFNLEFVSKNNC